MDGLISLFYTAFFFVFFIVAFRIVRTYIFSRVYGWFSYILIFFYQLIIPLLYSIFIVGSTVLIYRAFSGHVALEWLAPIFYILYGASFMSVPVFIHFRHKLIRLYTIFLVFGWLGLGISISAINPPWNDQLERHLLIELPSIGLFFILTSLITLMVIGAHYLYHWADENLLEEG